MRSERRVGRWVSLVALAAAFILGTGVTACRTSTDDVHRWANTAQGPKKLVAVLTHDKYPLELRIEAAMTLVRMKPRGGRRVGIQGRAEDKGLINALAELPPAERTQIISGMVPQLEEAMRAEPPKAQTGQPSPPDPSFPFKDAAFALLTHDDGSLIVNDENRQRLKAALVDWAAADFSNRMDESSQIFGMEQVLRYLKADGVRKLPDLMAPDAKKIDRMAELIADLGDDETKLRASKKLTEIAKEVDSDVWVKKRTPMVEAANQAAGLTKITPDQFKAQLAQFQEDELLKVFTSMKKVGGKPSVDFLVDYAKTKTEPDLEKRRAAALAALEGNIDKADEGQVAAMLDIAGGKDTPDVVRDVALRRVGEMPRKLVVGKLFELFDNDNWKIRWVAAELVLKMSDTSNVDEFMRRIGRIKGMAITEPLRYGALISEMKGPKKPIEIADKYANGGYAVETRMSALGYYYEVGTKDQLSKVKRYEDDRSKAPSCKEDADDCEWKCSVGEGKSQELKDITTLGEFVRYCVEPAMEKRSKSDKDKKDKK